MATLITDPKLEEQLRAQRAEWGGDRYDEVWEGTYLMNPLPELRAFAPTEQTRVWAFQTAPSLPVPRQSSIRASM